MAIGTPVILVAAWDTSNVSSYTVTPSPAPTRGTLLVCFSDTSHGTLTAPTSTPTGLGLDWTLRGSQDHPTDVRRIFAHTAPVHAGVTVGDITLTMTGANLPSTGTGHAIVQIAGVDLAQPVVRVASTNVNSTSITLTLPKPLSVANRWLVFKSHRANEATTPRAVPWAELSDTAGASPSRGANVQWLPGVVTSTGILETAASASWTTSGQASIIALELQARPDRQFWLFDVAVAVPVTGTAAVTLANHTSTTTAVETIRGSVGAADYFERADGPLGANWVTTGDPFAIVSGRAVASSSSANMHWLDTFPQDMANEIDVELGANSAEIDLVVRANPLGLGIFGGWFSTGASTGDYYLDAATFNSTAGAAPGSNVTLRLEVTATTARLLANGVEVLSGSAGASSGSLMFVGDSGTNPSPIEAWRATTVTLANFTSTATGSVGNATGTVAVTLADFTSTAAGLETITGTSAQTLADFTSTAAGMVVVNVTGTSAQTLADFTSTASGLETFTGTSAQTLADFTSTAAGVETIIGTSAQTLAAFTSTAAGLETFTGTSAQTLADYTSTAAGVVANPVTGTSAQTLADFTSTAAGLETISGASAQVLADFTSTASGSSVLDATGTVAVTLAAFTSTASGDTSTPGTAAVVLEDFTSTASGQLSITGTSAQTLTAFTSTAAGLETITGSSAQTLADFTSTASGTTQTNITGTATPALADHTSTAAGVVLNPVTGAVAVTLEAFTSTAAGVETVTGTSATTLAAFTSTAAGITLEGVTGACAVTLEDFTCAATNIDTIGRVTLTAISTGVTLTAVAKGCTLAADLAVTTLTATSTSSSMAADTSGNVLTMEPV